MVNDAKDDGLRRWERRVVFKEGYRQKAQARFIKNGGKPGKTYQLKHNMKQEDA